MRKFFSLFSGSKLHGRRQQSVRAASSGASLNTSVTSAEAIPVVCRSKSGEFQIEIGGFEKHVFEGKLISQCDMVLSVDGQSAATRMNFSKLGTTEIYEGDIGVRGRLLVRIEREPGVLPASKSKIRVNTNGRLARIFQVRPQRSPRYLIFQHVMPCMFLLVVLYYALVCRPEVGYFYSKLFGRSANQPTAPARKQSVPTPTGKNQQFVWHSSFEKSV